MSWPWLGIIGIFLLALSLHFWGLARFNTLVFDEVYYPKYANNYLTHTPFFDAHPPLGKYIIAIGMWLSDIVPLSPTEMNGLTGSMRSPFSYRWLNALTGSLLPLVVAGIAYQISQRWRYALIAGLFTAVDGLFLVESRYALINIYLIFFGLLGQWLFLIALGQQEVRKRWGWLALAGICCGASVAVKWNGLAFLVGLYLVWIAAWVSRWMHQRFTLAIVVESRDVAVESGAEPQTPLQHLTQLHWPSVLVNLGIIPALIYSLVWVPHLQINQISFWEVHRQMLGYHTGMGTGPDVHPYCSRWYTWPWMIRPMSYFYETTQSLADPLPPLHPPMPAGTGQVVYDVHAMGNPFLWWFSTLALLLLIEMLIEKLLVWSGNTIALPSSTNHTWISLYISLNYAASFLPWIGVSRCTFIYLYMGAAIFGFLAIAYIVDQWIASPQVSLRAAGITIIFVILLAFVFWLPVYLGLPLSNTGFQARMWLRSWI
jgi:dolichyl-phosphate-mannose--protein O-mannosyl transferase